jgi:hypothetical protein
MTLSAQRCLHHPTREAVARCPECRHTFCRECVTEHEDRMLCAGCLHKQFPTAQSRRTRALSGARAGQLLCGLVVAWLFFYWLGQGLLAIPSSFHNGTVWEAGLLEQP